MHSSTPVQRAQAIYTKNHLKSLMYCLNGINSIYFYGKEFYSIKFGVSAQLIFQKVATFSLNIGSGASPRPNSLVA